MFVIVFSFSFLLFHLFPGVLFFTHRVIRWKPHMRRSTMRKTGGKHLRSLLQQLLTINYLAFWINLEPLTRMKTFVWTRRERRATHIVLAYKLRSADRPRWKRERNWQLQLYQQFWCLIPINEGTESEVYIIFELIDLAKHWLSVRYQNSFHD